MSGTVIFSAHKDIRRLAVQACDDHDQQTYLWQRGTTMHEFQRTELIYKIFSAFRREHGAIHTNELEEEYGAAASIRECGPFFLEGGGGLHPQSNEVYFLLPLGFLQKYPSQPQPATGFRTVHVNGLYEPVVCARSTYSQDESLLHWETGKYIRVSSGTSVEVKAGVIFCLMISLTFQAR